MDLDTDNDINIDFEVNSPHQEGIITETYQRPDNSYIKEPSQLGDLLDTSVVSAEILTKADRYRYNFRNYTVKSVEGYTFT